ncbi:glutamate--tRNA ligase [Candidatus Woesebacteria bacterium]|nr:glutamate--tRNA ligase [Candidatus Woesebacteria bacterium]
MNKARTRFAPSPTGSLHIGGLRTALYAYALAKHENGDFILRIEDTDKKREVTGSREKIEELLTLFGLKWDEHYVQSERVEKGIYKKAAEKLEKSGHAYNEGGAIRLKIPKNEKVDFYDFVLNKDIEWDTNTLENLVLLKSDGFPTYHLAVVVDDNNMNISHVLRGHDWLPSTPIHLLVYKYLGYEIPEIGHLTDILDPEGGKLSKRRGSFSVEALLSEGYLPEAILNFVMLLGWAPKDNRELFTLDEFVKAFDPKGFQKANPIFNREKLDWFNGQYIRQLPDKELNSRLKTQDSRLAELSEYKQLAITSLVKDRIKKLSEFRKLAGFFFEWQKPASKMFGRDYKDHLAAAINAIEEGKSLENVPKEKRFKVGDFFMDLRVAITGSKFTPPINESVKILGKKEALARIKSLL